MLRYHLVKANDGPCNQLGEKANELTIVQEALYVNVTPVTIYQESNLLEGIKTDGKGQHNFWNNKMAAHNGIEIFDKKGGILKIAEGNEVYGNAGYQEESGFFPFNFPPGDGFSNKIIQADRT